ncbi:MAG: IS4 family transposase, partial [Planctomycetaceae bacterium]|nr:IS4 family transposase [Planctomycetaceae bacterium]
FKGAKQTLEAFQPIIALQSNASQRENLYGHLLMAIAYHRVGNRPGRFEPRKRKRREKRYYALLQPRHEAKLDLLKRFTKI